VLRVSEPVKQCQPYIPEKEMQLFNEIRILSV